VTSTEEGRALLRALGLDASQSVATFRTLSRVLARRRFGFGLGAAFGAAYVSFITTAGRHPSSVAVAMFVLALAVALGLTVAPTRLSVGADGIVLRWLGRQRFIGYEDIELVTRFDRSWGRSRIVGLSLLLRSNEQVMVPISSSNWPKAGAVDLIEERIREAMETYRTGGAAADAALLRRGERRLGEWVAALRALGAGANADMRTAPVPRERLFRIVEDPACAPTDRAAAAVALGGDGALDDDGRARLRAVAEATAAPRLRVAIEKAAAAPDSAELEAALADVEGEKNKLRA
jgi:hypothetical protein